MKNKTKNTIIILLSILSFVLITIIVILFNNKNNLLQQIQGKVIVADSDYIIIENDNEKFIINNVKNAYDIGDIVLFTYKEKNLNKKSNPKSIEIENEELVQKFILENKESSTNEKIQNNESENKQSSKNDFKEDNKDNNNSSTTNIEKTETADTIVLSYFNELQKEFDSGNIKESLKEGFITVVDFIFYNGTIKGYTFKDLSDSAKLKVLSMGLYFDNKIEKYFPGYKESISDKANKIYTNVKKEIIESYLNTTIKVCENNTELCNRAKENFNELKSNFNLTWSLIKDIAGDGVDKLKNWYEIFKGN